MICAAQHPQIKKRTLTNLHNEQPTWLRLVARLGRRVGETGTGQPLADGRALRGQGVLAALLRLNTVQAALQASDG